MPESFSFLIVRLQMEKEKLLGWAILAKISDDDEKMAVSGFKVNRHTVIDALREIQILLLDSSRLHERYKLNLVPAPPDSHHVAPLPLKDDYSTLQKKALSFIDKTRRYPRRLQWAAFDKTHFEYLLSDLQSLNDNMMGFLDVYERNRHFQMQEATFMQILQVNNKMHDLFELMHSLKESASTDDNDKRRSAYKDRIIRMTRFKAVSIAVETGSEDASSTADSSLRSKTDIPGSEIAFHKLKNLFPDTEERPPRSLTTLSSNDEIPVWIECDTTRKSSARITMTMTTTTKAPLSRLLSSRSAYPTCQDFSATGKSPSNSSYLSASAMCTTKIRPASASSSKAYLLPQAQTTISAHP